MELFNRRVNIDNGFNVNIIGTNKFHTNLMSLYIIRPLDREEVTKNAILPLTLMRGTEKYNTNLELQRKLKHIDGSNFNFDVNKKGEKQILRFSVEYPKDEVLERKEYFTEMINLLYEIVYNPKLEYGTFLKLYIEEEKRNLENKINNKISNKSEYALNRCIEEMCKNEKFSTYEYGYIEDLEYINNVNLYKHYKNILSTSPIEMVLVGDFRENSVEKIKRIFQHERNNIINIPKEKNIISSQTKNMIYEEMSASQGELVMGYRTGICWDDELYEAFVLVSEILDGRLNSKLFKKSGQEESLAYNVYTKIYKYKSIFLINSGIDSEMLQTSIDFIRTEIDELKKGDFSQDDINISKKSVVDSIKSIENSNFLISEFFLSQVLFSDRRNIEDLIDKINNVKKEEIVEAARKLNLDTIYFLKNKGKY